MQHETQVTLAKRIFALIDSGGTDMSDACASNPVSAYSCPTILKHERQRLFTGRPVLIATSCQLKAPGDYLTDDRCGVPILLVRNRDGKLNAFANVCRHRGARLANGCGRDSTSFVCPYHGWGYNLEGKLRILSPRGAFPGLDCEHTDLVRFPVAERHGLIWVLPQPGGTINEDALLPGLDSELASYGLADFTHFGTRALRKRLNWKLAIDTFLESWHIDKLHRETINPIFLPGIGLVDTFGDNMRLTFPRRSIVDMRNQPEENWDLLRHTLIVYVLFPNTLLNWQGRHFEIWRMFPAADEDPDQCIAEASLYTPTPVGNAPTDAYWRRNFDLLMNVVEKEDFDLAEQIQRGFNARTQQSITFGRHEPALGYYHERLRRAVAADREEKEEAAA
ncbi:Rieske 2Fe-2S domain-containing protein [Burkholderia ambifaria]|uniref:aromatic ring-hydroxylating oxygenase subunit alpha n=1 Tax=Burkholderia ambifaria TaxID=152480 RepID=UPI001E2E39F6|nr:SRPBCC family protein [Burkholderia ambifaria]UEP25495.1 Rieske 2Fe-2S domain-containing protein [Burkholderia ambifaria]